MKTEWERNLLKTSSCHILTAETTKYHFPLRYHFNDPCPSTSIPDISQAVVAQAWQSQGFKCQKWQIWKVNFALQKYVFRYIAFIFCQHIFGDWKCISAIRWKVFRLLFCSNCTKAIVGNTISEGQWLSYQTYFRSESWSFALYFHFCGFQTGFLSSDMQTK